jgi:DNA-binding transcriptional LysR family regulator
MAPRIGLDQWSALVAVVEAGGYAAAAERLHRTQSTVTYTIKKLEDQLGVNVFERKGRKAVLTPTGQVLYRRGRTLVEEAARLERAAADLARGHEPQIRLAIDVVYPTWLLLDCLKTFGGEQPDTRIELYETVLGGTDEALIAGEVDLAIGSAVPGGFLGDPLMQLRFVCVAAAAHPLNALGRAVTFEDLRAYRHLVVRDSGAQRTRAGGWLNEKRWTVSHKATSIHAVCIGAGYAWFPEDTVRAELETGRLVRLPLAEGAERYATLYLVIADAELAGPGTMRLAALLRERTRQACEQDGATTREARPADA